MTESTQTAAFFAEIYAGKPEGHTVVVWSKAGAAKRTTYPLSAESAVQDALAAEGDVYAGVCYAGPGMGAKLGPRKRPGLGHVSGLVGLWCDLDVNGGPEGKTGGASTVAVALELVNALPVEPTMIVNSGYGVQPWWLFETPLMFDQGERNTAAELAVRWYAMLRERAAALEPTFGIDATHDLSRVLRVPGTVNRKGGLEAPVVLLDHTATRYSVDELSELVQHVRIAPTLFAVNGDGSSFSATTPDEVIVDVREEAQPPFDKFEALRAIEPRFGGSWDRTRPEGREWSASEWDMSLASLAVAAGWTPQEVTDLLVAARRKHGDDLKRPDYYARTIAKVHVRAELDELEEARAEAVAELTEPAVGADGDPDDTFRLLSTVLGIKASGWIQYGLDPDTGGQFALVLGDGREVRIGNSEVVLAPAKFQARLHTATGGHVMPTLKKDEWLKIVSRLKRVVTIVDSPEESARAVLEAWLEAYTADTLTADRVEAARTGYPFHDDGKLFIRLESLRTWLRTRYGERLDQSRLQQLLKAAGFRGEGVSYRTTAGTPTSRYYFARPLRRLEAVA